MITKTRVKDTASFIEAARAAHGDKYSYFKTIYTVNKAKVVITCPIHGDFEQRADNHVHNMCGCPDCCDVVSATKAKSTAKPRTNKVSYSNGYSADRQRFIKNRYDIMDEANCRMWGEVWGSMSGRSLDNRALSANVSLYKMAIMVSRGPDGACA